MFREAYRLCRHGHVLAARVLLVCAAMAACGTISVRAQTSEQAPGASADQSSQAASRDTPQAQTDAPIPASVTTHAGLPGAPVTKRQRRRAESAYFEGAKRLDHDELEAAQRDFEQAARLDPGNGGYAAAVTVARQQRVVELVRQVSAARRAGNENKAQSLLAAAREIDPGNPLVLEHAERPMSMAGAFVARSGALQDIASGPSGTPARGMPAGEFAATPWRIVPNAGGPTHLTPTPGTQSFDLAGDSWDVVRRAFLAYGIKAAIDGSVDHKNLRFTMEEATYSQALNALTGMANIFLVPVDETTVLAAKNDEADRGRLERQLEETIYLPGLPADQFNQMVQVLRGIFDRAILNSQAAAEAILVRAPEDVMGPLNETVRDLQEPSGEVVVEVRLYEVEKSNMLNAGVNIPTQFGIFNVDQAASQLVSQNSALVQQAIAQGLISATASNFEIAAALIGSGLVQSNLLNSTIGVFGGGITQTGITETGSVGVNLGQNSSDTRTLDDAQLRVKDHETATFREGTRYPVATSTFSVGGAGAASGLGNLGNATINGQSVASLLSQFTQSSTTIPQLTYEDLGITLEATPTIQSSGRVGLKMKMKIEALTGNSINNIPVLGSREFDSDLTVGDGQSALLSSLVSNSEVRSMSGLPGLSELPGFQLPLTDNVEKQSTELVVVVTPHVVRQRMDMMAGPRIPVPPELAGR